MNYKDGRTLKKYYCKCGKIISTDIFLYGSKKCRACARKGYKISKVTKEKISKSLKGRKRPEIGKLMKEKGNHRPKCINCKKELYNYHSKYCWNCYILLELNKGINASNYINGNSKKSYPSKFNKELKEFIRKRDNYVCQKCNMTEEEHLIVYGFVLDVHHIDYDKENCEENNLISLCKSCNIRANYNRKYWENYFKIKSKEIKL